MKILIDTNVVIDVMTSREPWKESAEKIFIMAANNIVDMYITASSATDIYYLIRKHIHSVDAAKQILNKLYSLVSILDVKEEDCLQALSSSIPDYEDAVIEQVANRSDMECIVTRNQKDFTAGTMKIYLPDEFIELMKQTEI